MSGKKQVMHTHRCMRHAVSHDVKLFSHMPHDKELLFCFAGECSRQTVLHEVDNLPLWLTLAPFANQVLAEPCGHRSSSVYQAEPSDAFLISSLKMSLNQVRFHFHPSFNWWTVWPLLQTDIDGRC